MIRLIPFFIGVSVGLILYASIGWWGFLILFPWIGLSISIGINVTLSSKGKRKSIGRRISLLLILPALLLFVPLVNHENFQLEGVVLIILVGYFSKGFIHYAVAKLLGPLIWGRGFCGWSCWTAAVLDWLPINTRKRVPGDMKNLRYLTLIASFALPIALVYGYHYDVRESYIGKAELRWMLTGSAVYYLAAVPLAIIMSDKRAFCKMLCPVSIVMKVPARFALIKKRPSDNKCTQCGVCTKVCTMDIDVMSYISQSKKVTDTECILCNECRNMCPQGAIK